MGFPERIRELRDELKKSQAAFGEDIGVSRDVINNFERIKKPVEPSQLVIERICEVYQVNREWLSSGRGEMFKDLSREEKIATFVGEALADESDPFKANMISILAGLDENGWKALKNAAEILMKATKKEDG